MVTAGAVLGIELVGKAEFGADLIANNGDYQCARTILEAALALDPQNARSIHYYSQLLSGMGEFDLAFPYADKANAAAADADTRNFVRPMRDGRATWRDNTTGC